MPNTNYQDLVDLSTSKPLRSSLHAPIFAHFSKNADDFVVRELPLYEASGAGEHIIVHVQKKGLTTKELLSALSAQTGVKMRDIGFAGLKDKEGLTSQFISLPAKSQSALNEFKSENIKILSVKLHNNKLKTGHLAGNSFFIRLKKVSPSAAKKLEFACQNALKNGIPNYFGYQRFGKFNDNAKQGYELLKSLQSGKKSRLNPKMTNFLLSAFQSELFNRWLSLRVKISHFAAEFSASELGNALSEFGIDKALAKELKKQENFFKIFVGDILGHYPRGAVFACEDLNAEIIAFLEQRKTLQGPLFGKKLFASSGLPKEFESIISSPFGDVLALLNGARRPAIIWPKNLECKYNEQNAQFSLSFELIKGAYATNFLREILGADDIFDIKEDD